jgi:pimeloyl-ACP methyl ester carboxylesterase
MVPTGAGRGRLICGIAFAALAAVVPSGAASHRVDIGGYRLYLRCAGAGSPVVILDAGAGDTLETWDWVLPDVRKFTRVCAYERAGLGRSEAGLTPRTSERIVEELQALLSRGRITGPYLLVGHSFGGLNMRLYAARHPDDIVGLVLVDATPEDYPGQVAALLSPSDAEKLRTVRGLASAAFLSELDNMADSAAAVRAATPIAAPVIVLSSARGDGGPSMRALWTSLQARMASSFPNGRQIIAEDSGHYIQFDRPELVVDAIREIVTSWRRSTVPDRRGSSD